MWPVTENWKFAGICDTNRVFDRKVEFSDYQVVNLFENNCRLPIFIENTRFGYLLIANSWIAWLIEIDVFVAFNHIERNRNRIEFQLLSAKYLCLKIQFSIVVINFKTESLFLLCCIHPLF